MFKLLKKGTKSDFYIIIGILLLFLLKATLSSYLNLGTHEQTLINILINVFIIIIVLITLMNKIKNQQELNIKENLLNGLVQESRTLLNKIISTTQDSQIKEPAMQLNKMIDNIRAFNKVKNDTDYQPEKLLKKSKVNRNLRKGIVAVLIALMIGSLVIYIETVVELTESKINQIAETYSSETTNNNDNYMFIVDEKGIIFDHPDSEYNALNIKDTEYLGAYLSGKPTIITDYTGSWRVCFSKKDSTTDQYNVLVLDLWTIYSICGSNLLLGIILLIIFLLCIIIVDLFIDRLFDWQDSVNNQLEKAIANAVAAGKAKSQFFAQMSHEIRTPINAVIGMNEMILRECTDSTIIKYAQNAHAASESLLSLINDILDFSKLESEKMELVEETYKLDELIRNLINMIKFRAEKKELDFRVRVNENIPNELFGDSTRIRQVVVNFLTNAVKYTKVGGIVFSVDMELGLDEDTGVKRQLGELLLKFSVKDSGIGIRDEDKSKLFKDFERFDAKQNKNIEGTGLGLAITAKLVKLMRGKIEVDSIYGEGSTFTVLVPQKVIGKKGVGRFEEKVKVEKNKTDVYRVSFIAPSAKILVVDDNEMNLLVATSLLKATKIQVDTAMSGIAALKKLADKPYDLVFLDQMMPNLDGIQTLKLAKEMEGNKSKGVPMIALTANAISGAKEMFLREGFTDYLSKPIDARELEKMLMEYLPKEKLREPSSDTDTTEKSQKLQKNMEDISSVPQVIERKDTRYSYLNPELGLQYSAGMEDMYQNVLEMFCKLKDDKKSQMKAAFDSKDWNNYTTLVHALKSTSLSVGGKACSEAAKQLEAYGKILISTSSSETDKHEAEEYISTHHQEAMKLYDKLVDEGRNYLNLGVEKGSENVVSEEKLETKTEVDTNDDDINSTLQEAFNNEDWLMYSILIDQVDGVDKNIKMACQMITSDFTNDQEKNEAIQYIKDNHDKLMNKK